MFFTRHRKSLQKIKDIACINIICLHVVHKFNHSLTKKACIPLSDAHIHCDGQPFALYLNESNSLLHVKMTKGI
ncbi:hypothetical protein FX988_01835 [Paraglaciecola mesophila]|uniref:Uncharacterized protein n=1 Tax=Paraglaciecola mesophila TaxID=197222 RepID=A0A857JKU0_9ALTE|nr:hypothetical protein FX988_01835 [Paraglaciecola mesophila]